MDAIITFILLILILGIIIFIHEFGHFITAKKSGVYVEEFSLGMGSAIFKYKPKKSETTYSLRIFPIGGYVAMADKEDSSKKIKKDRVLENKSTLQKILVFAAGIIMNFILAYVLFFVSALLYGRPINEPIIGAVVENTPAFEEGIEVGDKIISINDNLVYNWDDVMLELSAKKLTSEYKFEIIKEDGSKRTYKVMPIIHETEDGDIREFGIGSSETKYIKGFKNAVIYSIESVHGNSRLIFKIIKSLFLGKISLNNLSGPVGIYTVVDQVKSSGLISILYLTAYLSINVGIVNLFPIPVFDGGRILIVLIEKALGKKTPEKLELILNFIGFAFMILLMIYVTFNDILRLV